MRVEALSPAEGDEAKCPACGGHVRRWPYGELHAGAYVSDDGRVEISGRVREGFKDPVVLDAATQYFNGVLYRLYKKERYLSGGKRRLHVDVWEDVFGKRPPGTHIHHRDGDPSNNSIDNLECMAASEHLKWTWRNRDARGLSNPIGELARDRAAEWHRSETGRAWHKRHAFHAKSWEKWKREDRPCLHCGKVFPGLAREGPNAQRYCSALCKRRDYRRKRDAASLSG